MLAKSPPHGDANLGHMDFFLLLILGGAVAYSWARIDKLDRRVAFLSQSLEQASRTERPIAPPPRVEEVSGDKDTSDDSADEPAPLAASRIAEEEPPEEPPEPVLEEVEPPVSQSEADRSSAEPAMAYENAAEAVQSEVPSKGFSFDFEDIFGRRLPIWGGGFALAIAGIFLVRYSIEAGLVTPAVRVAMSFVFGLALLAGAEAAFRLEERLHDPRVRQALAGAGLATLYGAFYLAGTAYGLIGAGSAFVGLSVVTAAAIALSFRFGLPCAVIGLVGGFAAPLLVDSNSANVPLLSFYLALITGGLAWSGQVQGRNWLGYAALAGGLGWGAIMMFAGVSSSSDFAALGVYLIVLGTLLPALLHAKGGPSLPKLAAGAVATLQMAVLVSDGGFAPLTWGLYLLIGAALSALGWRYAVLRLGTLIASGLGLWLLLIWSDPSPQFFALITAGLAAIFAGVPLVHQIFGRAKLLDLAQLSGVSLGLGIVIYVQFGFWNEQSSDIALAASMAGLALLPVAAFASMWRRGDESNTRASLMLLASAAALTFAALLLITPAWLAPVMALAVCAPLLLCYWRRSAVALHIAAWFSAAVVLITLIVTPGIGGEFSHLGDSPSDTDIFRAALRWIAAATPFAIMAFIGRGALSLRIGEGIAVALLYGVIAQILPSAPLAWIAALAAMAMIVWQPGRSAAWAAALTISGLWALEPLATWAIAGALAILGEPFLLESAITPADLALRVLPFAACFGLLFVRGKDSRIELRAPAALATGILAAIILHSLYKQLFGIGSLLHFEFYGMGERTVWQGALLLAAYGVWQGPRKPITRPLTLGLIAIALAHFLWFTVVLHNPLITVQHVGPTPLANWLSFSFLSALAGLWLAQVVLEKPAAPRSPAFIPPALDAARMTLIALLAYSLLRQVFAGSILTSRAIDQTESLLISLLGIVLALAFLWWGSWRDRRSWRIGSLVLMLAAVVKVFLIDAAGLEGLLRIASFMALGFSLIGIGWVYSRQLSARADGEEKVAEKEPSS